MNYSHFLSKYFCKTISENIPWPAACLNIYLRLQTMEMIFNTSVNKNSQCTPSKYFFWKCYFLVHYHYFHFIQKWTSNGTYVCLHIVYVVTHFCTRYSCTFTRNYLRKIFLLKLVLLLFFLSFLGGSGRGHKNNHLKKKIIQIFGPHSIQHSLDETLQAPDDMEMSSNAISPWKLLPTDAAITICDENAHVNYLKNMARRAQRKWKSWKNRVTLFLSEASQWGWNPKTLHFIG